MVCLFVCFGREHFFFCSSVLPPYQINIFLAIFICSLYRVGSIYNEGKAHIKYSYLDVKHGVN